MKKLKHRRMPAEWEPHSATWICWPANAEDWPGKFEPIKWVYAEITRLLTKGERVEIICQSADIAAEAKSCLDSHLVKPDRYRLHILETDRSWLRDTAPTAVCSAKEGLSWIKWGFNAWAKYDDYSRDVNIPALVAEATRIELVPAKRCDRQQEDFVLEGGAIDTDGEGTLLVTEECLLSEQQCRNPGMSREAYEEAFAEYLGIEKTIWLPGGIDGDDTHGHIDDAARFVAPGVVVLAFEEDISKANHSVSVRNYETLSKAADARGRALKVVKLPMPEDIFFAGQKLPASYANFYIANGQVLVPTFNDANDRRALNILAELFPEREVTGLHSVDLVLGLGTLHCLTQQQPA